MSEGWSLQILLANLHASIEGELNRAREALAHPTEKGDASESVWIDVFNQYLPRRYVARKAHVVDCQGQFSEQIDVVIHDRQYSPLIFQFKDSFVVPAESVYAVFEAKQDLSAAHIEYAHRKISSVRRLHRTTVPVPTVDGVKQAKEPGCILGGLLTLSSTWKPPLGETMLNHLRGDMAAGRIDIGCVANSGYFASRSENDYEVSAAPRSSTRFLFELIGRLQDLGTVPMLDIRAYGAHIPND
jgi:hypothetical protein